MADYDYREGKKRLETILDGEMEIIEQDKVPSEDEFTFDNGYYSCVSAVFVDIRKSTELFNDEDKVKVAKIIRSFTSEIIEISRKGDNLREIGIRGDCVYAIYTTPKKYDVYEIAVKTFWINTYVNMLNKLLDDRDFPQICIGIGASAAQELVVKAGRKNTGINSKVWIGNAVTTASHLSSEGSKNGNASILFSECFYSNCIDELVNVDGEEVRRLFTRKYTSKLGNYYSANVVMSEYDEWINEGMMD
jgi:class 3 adenylate cyclase